MEATLQPLISATAALCQLRTEVYGRSSGQMVTGHMVGMVGSYLNPYNNAMLLPGRW